MKTIPALILTLLALCSTAAWAGQTDSGGPRSPWSVSGFVEAPLNSKYMWRGLTVVNEPVLQPSAEITLGHAELGSLSFNLWANYELTDVNHYGPRHGSGKNKVTEVDLTLTYAYTWRSLTVSAGVAQYIYPNTEFPSSAEFFARLEVDWLVTPSLTIYQEVPNHKGQYLMLGLDWGCDLPGAGAFSWRLEAGGSIGFGSADYTNYQFGVDRASATDAGITLSLPLTWILPGGRGLSLSFIPHVSASTILESRVRDSQEHRDQIWAGAALRLDF